MSVKLLTEQNLESLSIKEGCTGLSESTLVKLPHCLKSHVAAHLYLNNLDRVSAKGPSVTYIHKSGQYFFDKKSFYFFPFLFHGNQISE